MDSHVDTEKHLTVGPAVRTWPMSWLNLESSVDRFVQELSW